MYILSFILCYFVAVTFFITLKMFIVNFFFKVPTVLLNVKKCTSSNKYFQFGNNSGSDQPKPFIGVLVVNSGVEMSIEILDYGIFGMNSCAKT